MPVLARFAIAALVLALVAFIFWLGGLAERSAHKTGVPVGGAPYPATGD